MKEIIIKRDQENINKRAIYKVVISDGETVLIKNGETKKVRVDLIPTKVRAKMNWLKSRKVTIDSATSEITLKGEKIKNWVAPRILGLRIGLLQEF
jgi:hypothetical protein